MKKLITLLLAVALVLSLAACGGGNEMPSNNTNTPQNTENTNTPPIENEMNISLYSVGDTVSTDIFEFTLDEAALAIALNNINDDKQFLPKEYNAQDDANNPYVAPIGHTYVAFTYTVNNLNRASSEFHNGSFVSVEYDGKTYDEAYSNGKSNMVDGLYFPYQDSNFMDTNGKLKTEEGNKWYRGASKNLLLKVGEKETRRAYYDIPIEVNSLLDDFNITVSVPNSDGTKTDFTYLVTAE